MTGGEAHVGPSFDDTVLLLELLAGRRVSVDIRHASGSRFVALVGMLRRCAPDYVELTLECDPDDVAAFYVDGGQAGGDLPAVVLHREHFVGLNPDMPTAAVAWAVGQTMTAVTPGDDDS